MSVLSYFHEVFLKFLLAFFWWLDVGWVVCLYEGMEDEYAWMCVNNMFLHEQWHGIEWYMNIPIWHDNHIHDDIWLWDWRNDNRDDVYVKEKEWDAICESLVLVHINDMRRV